MSGESDGAASEPPPPGSDAAVGELSRGSDAAIVVPVQPSDEGALPTQSCEGRAPSAFVSQCGGCHRLGSELAGAPDLLQFDGGESALVARVRAGAGAMP
ncbi:MAG TPA: hypothetical protein VFZ61_17655, partial [Polyangiales bacterium]